MAGYPHHRGSDSSGRTSRRTSGGRTQAGALLPAVAVFPDEPDPLPAPDPAVIARSLGPEIAPADVNTSATCRLLSMRGLSEREATNVTAVLAGLAVSPKSPWTRRELNRVLFLRELYRSAWGERERLA